MFYYIEGIVKSLSSDSLVIDCSGVGFEISITPNTASALSLGKNAKIFIMESIGEDHFDLFGFMSENEKRFFKMLTSVSGIGPKAAMSILSYNAPDSLALSIVNGNEAALTACPGIGKKTAQRIILELKDKLVKSMPSSGIAPENAISAPVQARSGAYDDALAALAMLGYSTADVVPVLKQINVEGLSSEQIIRAVLKFMV